MGEWSIFSVGGVSFFAFLHLFLFGGVVGGMGVHLHRLYHVSSVLKRTQGSIMILR